MNLSDQTPPPLPNPQLETTVSPRMTLLARLLNVFAVPGHVFNDVLASRHAVSNWLVPLLLATLVSVLTFVELARPSLIAEVRARYKTFSDEQVKSGKFQQTDADNALATFDSLSNPITLKVGTTIASFAISAARILFWAFLIWWLGILLFKVRFRFAKALEVSGLASMIGVLAAVATLVLMTNFGADTGAGQTMEQLGAKEKMPIRIVLANIFSVWFVGVLASGLARLAGVHFMRALMLVLGCWIALQVLLGMFLLGAVGLMR